MDCSFGRIAYFVSRSLGENVAIDSNYKLTGLGYMAVKIAVARRVIVMI